MPPSSAVAGTIPNFSYADSNNSDDANNADRIAGTRLRKRSVVVIAGPGVEAARGDDIGEKLSDGGDEHVDVRGSPVTFSRDIDSEQEHDLSGRKAGQIHPAGGGLPVPLVQELGPQLGQGDQPLAGRIDAFGTLSFVAGIDHVVGRKPSDAGQRRYGNGHENDPEPVSRHSIAAKTLSHVHMVGIARLHMRAAVRRRIHGWTHPGSARLMIVTERIHDDEPDTSEWVVRSLLEAECPAWAGLPLECLRSSGTSNAMWRLRHSTGPDVVVRLPRHPEAAADTARELRVLELLEREEIGSIVSTPRVVHAGRPNEVFPHAWSVLGWLHGTDAWAATGRVDRPDSSLAEDLARCAGAIGSIGTDDAMWIRARAFELEHAVSGVLYYVPKKHPLGDVMARTLARILHEQ